ISVQGKYIIINRMEELAELAGAIKPQQNIIAQTTA
ncbi:TPA: transcriptional regulator FNR, partial [Mannheimia haemolytica]|nr:transcriptional regulator FNR [Mannheimia haemolytica]